MNVGDPTRKIPGFEEVYSRGTERRGKQKTENRIQNSRNSATEAHAGEIQKDQRS
jgi:hypothetical protein